jgi:hypothetical protein
MAIPRRHGARQYRTSRAFTRSYSSGVRRRRRAGSDVVRTPRLATKCANENRRLLLAEKSGGTHPTRAGLSLERRQLHHNHIAVGRTSSTR